MNHFSLQILVAVAIVVIVCEKLWNPEISFEKNGNVVSVTGSCLMSDVWISAKICEYAFAVSAVSLLGKCTGFVKIPLANITPFRLAVSLIIAVLLVSQDRHVADACRVPQF
jgi:hypothetical protein